MLNREEARMSSCWAVDESAIMWCATSSFCPRPRRALSTFKRRVGQRRRISRALALHVLTLVLSFGVFLAVSSREAQGAEPTAQLPNLVADPPDGVHLETSTTEGGLKSPGEPKLLLRFNGYVHNAGPGALD